ncbi:MAG TPA: hypothetical protein VL128_14880 [Candidatus Eisenbacteria bacterium]|nr:hypothetical protein [Candidatus Eisenbacteria bacterium]
METMLGFAGLAVMTLLALFAALALESALLYAMLRLMQPAAAGRRPARLEMARGTRFIARAFETRR